MMRVLMVGGCHLDSKHLEEGHGITAILRAILQTSIPLELETISGVDVDHATPILRHLRKNCPDVLVIQPGGISCPKDVRSRMRHHPLLHRCKATSSVTASLMEPVALPVYAAEQRLRRTAQWWVRNLAKSILDRFCTLTGQPLANIDRLEQSTLQLVRKAQELGVRHIILLTPLPSADNVGRRYRAALSKRYKAAALPNDVHLIALGECPEFGASLTSYLADTRHLNSSGNGVVALAIAEQLAALYAATRAELPMAA